MKKEANTMDYQIIHSKEHKELQALPFYEKPSAEVIKEIANSEGIDNYTFEVKECFDIINGISTFSEYTIDISYNQSGISYSKK